MLQGTKKNYFCFMVTVISSPQNPLIKQILVLQDKSRARKKEQTFIIEGLREIQLAIKGNYVIDKLLFCSKYVSLSQVQELSQEASIIEVSEAVYNKIAYRGSAEGVIAFAKAKKNLLQDLELPKIRLSLSPKHPKSQVI